MHWMHWIWAYSLIGGAIAGVCLACSGLVAGVAVTVYCVVTAWLHAAAEANRSIDGEPKIPEARARRRRRD